MQKSPPFGIELTNFGANTLNSNRMEILAKWKCSTSKGLVEPLELGDSQTAVLSRASARNFYSSASKLATFVGNRSNFGEKGIV